MTGLPLLDWPDRTRKRPLEPKPPTPNEATNPHIHVVDLLNQFLTDRRGYERDQVRAHLKRIHDLAYGIDGILVLAFYGENPDARSGSTSIVLHFNIGDVDRMFNAVMAYERYAHANVYMPLAVMRQSLERDKKGSEGDVVAVLGLVLPLGSWCHECLYWANKSTGKKPRPAQREACCQKYTAIMQGNEGPKVPGRAGACKCFDERGVP